MASTPLTPKTDFLMRAYTLPNFSLYEIKQISQCSLAEIRNFHQQLVSGGFVDVAPGTVITGNTRLTLNDRGREWIKPQLQQSEDPKPIFTMLLALGTFKEANMRYAASSNEAMQNGLSDFLSKPNLTILLRRHYETPELVLKEAGKEWLREKLTPKPAGALQTLQAV